MLKVYCEECGEEVAGAVAGNGFIAASHPSPDDPEEECPGSGIEAEYASGEAVDFDDGEEVQDLELSELELEEMPEEEDSKAKPSPRRRGRKAKGGDPSDLSDLATELQATDLGHLFE